MWLLLLLFTYQGNSFYELYQSGSAKLESRDYHGAIEDLEAAVSLRKESSPTAKTYGVRFIAYFPYHQLAKAHLSLKDFDKARTYLDLAYQYEEDKTKDNAIPARMKMIEEMITVYGAEPAKPDIPDTTAEPVEEPSLSIQFMPVFDSIVQGDFNQALKDIEQLKEAYPNDPSLPRLEALALSWQATRDAQNTLEKSQTAHMDKIQKLWEMGERSEAAGDYEQAYHNFLAVKELKPEDMEAVQAVNRVRRELEDRGKSEAELQSAIETAQVDIAQLIESKVTLERNQEKMARENRDLLAKLDQFTNSKVKRSEIKVKWEIGQKGDRMANIHISVTSANPLKRVTLFLNEKQISFWEVDNQRTFRAPFMNNFKFEKYENELIIKALDDQGFNHSRTQSVPFPRPQPLLTRKAKRVLLLFCVTLVLAIFGVRQLRKRKAFRDRFNPYIAGAPILNEQMFYGRDTLLKQILNTLHNNSLMIYGERRIGKTSFLHRLNNMLPLMEDPQYQFIPVFIDLQGVRQEQFFATLDHEIGSVLEMHHITLDPPPEEMDHRQFTSRLRKYINSLKEKCEKKPKLVLLLDEVDVMNSFSEQTNQQLRSVFMKGFAEHIVAVMAGIHINTRWKSEGSPWYNFFEQIGLKPFSKNHADALITKPVNGIYQYSPEAVSRIMEITHGKPYLIQKMCLNLISHILAENKRRIMAEDVNYVFNGIKKEFYGAPE